MKKYSAAVVGATGLVGSEMIKTLLQRNFPMESLRVFATSRSAGTVIEAGGWKLTVEDIDTCGPAGVRVALFAGGEIASAEYAARFVDAGAVIIDNSAAFRMDPGVPLVVPEVNPQALSGHRGIIANPNCSTIQMVVVLKPIYDEAGIERVVTSTYQSVSGTGKAAVEELKHQSAKVLEGREDEAACQVYPHRIGFNLLPHIGSFEPNGYTAEEMKMILETRKIMGDDSIRLTATTVRVATMVGHSASINIETKKKITPERVREILARAPGVALADEPGGNVYPHTLMAAGRDEVFAGRIRQDLSCEKGIELFISADNLRKGAALNAVQIAEKMIEMELL